MIELFLIGFCMMLIFEGLGPLLIPNKWRKYMQEMSEMPSTVLQKVGAVLVLLGALGVYGLLP